MRSELRASLIGVLVLASACGNVHSLSLPSQPYVTIHGHVDLTTISSNGAPLLGGIIWGSLPSVPPVCYEQATDPVLAGSDAGPGLCPDPCGFFPGTIDETVTIDPDGGGDFDLPLYHLPPQTALVGDATDAVAYATIIVVADNNDDGRIELLHAINLRGGGALFGGGAEMDAGDADAGLPDASVPGLALETIEDTVLAASFTSVLQNNQERLSFLEGSFSALGDYYPAPACETPPTGFSVLETGPVASPTCLQLPDAGATCQAGTTDETIVASALDPQTARSLACRAHKQTSVTAQAPQAAPSISFSSAMCSPEGACVLPDGLEYHCIGTNLLVLLTASDCPTFLVTALKGCTDDPNCTTPMWDETASPPTWWPCNP